MEDATIEIAKLVLEYLRVLIWPAVVVIVCLVFKSQLVALLNRIRHAELPGGVVLDLGQEIREVKALSGKVREQPAPTNKKRGPAIPLTEANARMIKLGLRPSPSGVDMSYYRNLAEQDPSVALAGLRIEMDILARNLAAGNRVSMDEHDSGVRLIRRLYDIDAITSDQMQLTMKVLRVCNAAVHGTPVSREEAEDVIGSAEVLADQYLAWLSWGFDDSWTPRAELEAC